jgi:chromosome partitioning protein
MIRLVVANQRGGVAKTTTAHTIARFLADAGKKVLLIDTDPQGSIGAVLGLKPTTYLYHFMNGFALDQCIVAAHPNIDVLCSDRETARAELFLNAMVGRELVLQRLLTPADQKYDAVLIDVSPTITMMQTCAMVYAQRFLVPVSMDPLSLQGVVSCVESARILNDVFGLKIQPVALLPVMVDRRFAMTAVVLNSLKDISARLKIPILHPIRSDAAVNKANGLKKFLVDYDPKSKALEDYMAAYTEIMGLLQESENGEQIVAA